jgi:hypothetical protein
VGEYLGQALCLLLVPVGTPLCRATVRRGMKTPDVPERMGTPNTPDECRFAPSCGVLGIRAHFVRIEAGEG